MIDIFVYHLYRTLQVRKISGIFPEKIRKVSDILFFRKSYNPSGSEYFRTSSTSCLARGCSTLGQGHFPQIHLLPPPQIQKLADRSDVISEVPKCSQIQIFRPGPVGGAYSAPPDPLTFIFVRVRRMEKMDLVMKGLMGAFDGAMPPPRIFGLEPPLCLARYQSSTMSCKSLPTNLSNLAVKQNSLRPKQHEHLHLPNMQHYAIEQSY